MAQRLALFSFFGLAALADPLITVLRREGFTQFAQQLEGPAGEAIRNACNNLIVFAPTNAGLTRGATCSLQRRGEGDEMTEEEEKAEAAQKVVEQTKHDDRRAVITTGPGAISFVNWLNDPQFVNLGPGQNSSIVQTNRPNAALPVVFSGLGDSVKVTGLDIPFDCGVIRPISG